jgi:hypothetical protein
MGEFCAEEFFLHSTVLEGGDGHASGDFEYFVVYYG